MARRHPPGDGAGGKDNPPGRGGAKKISGKWGVTRFSREKERQIYFAITLAMLILWLVTRLG